MIKKAAIIGLLIFGFFFGAGNLIFPPSLGFLSGEHFWPSILGFILSGVGIAVLALIVGALNPKGYTYELEQRVSPWFATIFLVLLYLTIGPFFAIPRTASVAYEVAFGNVVPMDWNVWGRLIFTAFYFACAIAIAFNPSKILNRIGKIMTPIFVGCIILLVVLGLMKYGHQPAGKALEGYAANAFGTGFLEGYNTLDALASVAFSGVIVQSMRQLGFSSKKEYTRIVWMVGLVVGLLFSTLYLGLSALGNHFVIPAEVVSNADRHNGVYVLTQATHELFGSFGQAFLAIMVVMTCFTTTVGLIVSLSEYFEERFSWISYRSCAITFTLLGFLVANMGLNNIIQYSVPVLQILYPITIVFVLILLINKVLPMAKLGQQLTIGFVTILSILTSLAGLTGWTSLNDLVGIFQLSDLSMNWLLPSVVGILLACLLPNRRKSEDLSDSDFLNS